METPQTGPARLRSFVQRIERVREEIDALNADLSEIYKEARGEGWNVPAMKQIVAERHRMSKDANKYRELTDIVEIYRDALAGGTDDALARARAGAVNEGSQPGRRTGIYASSAGMEGDADRRLIPVSAARTNEPAPVASTEAAEGGDADFSPALPPDNSAHVTAPQHMPDSGEDRVASQPASPQVISSTEPPAAIHEASATHAPNSAALSEAEYLGPNPLAVDRRAAHG